MAKITYEFYTDNDAAELAELLCANKFSLGKYDSNLTAEKLLEYQQKKGTIFAIVGKKNGKVISFVAARETGGQKVARNNQVFVCSMLIDRKYRMALFSISEMFSFLMKELIKRGYTDLLCEVSGSNLASFYMMKKCGFVIIDDTKTLYGYYVLHNYLPGIVKMINQSDVVESENLQNIMQRIDKKKLYKAEEILSEHFVKLECTAGKDEYMVLVDTISGMVAGVDIKKKQFRILPKDGNVRTYILENYGKKISEVEIRMIQNDVVFDTIFVEEQSSEITIPVEIDTIAFSVGGDNVFNSIFIREIEDAKENIKIQSLHSVGNYEINDLSGFLSIAGQETSAFKEMWPHITAPYIEGIVVPNYDKNLIIEQKGDIIVVTQKTEDFILIREYLYVENQLEIHSKVKLISQKKCQPMFQFALYDHSYCCTVNLTDGTNVIRKFEATEMKMVSDEFIFANFIKQPYSEKIFESITLTFESEPDLEYIIKTNNPASCFCQLNYIGIVYDSNVYDEKNEIDFGVLSIQQNMRSDL